ncbi:hypothetical protein Sango_1266800 [Sesamum angolense]|uniref:DUF4283 domain-containing protein n=1 Tax=Sesamum angolense TaxID=2727404 RepID=A0AAE1WQR5_9LAMI|nr:hypothetical protein Sango_1266800 [Sesamum angolense]
MAGSLGGCSSDFGYGATPKCVIVCCIILTISNLCCSSTVVIDIYWCRLPYVAARLSGFNSDHFHPFSVAWGKVQVTAGRPVSGKPLATAGLPAKTTTLPTKVPVSVKETIVPTDIAKVRPLDFHGFISELEASPFATKNDATAVATGALLPAENAAVTTPKTSFAWLFSANRKLTTESMLTKFTIEDGPLTHETNDLIDVRTNLGFCLVGYIAGKFLGVKALRALSQSWGASFQLHDISWLIFRFARAEDKQRILAGGPYFVYGRPILLKTMPDCFEFKEDDISLTPIWATLSSLPLECWHPNALGKIGSRLGTPIAMDSLTMKMERVSYARILVEVDASKKLVDHVEFIIPNGVVRKQPIIYEYTPNLKTPAPKKAQPTEWTVVQHRQRNNLKQQQPAKAVQQPDATPVTGSIKQRQTAEQQLIPAAVPMIQRPVVLEIDLKTGLSGSSNDLDSPTSTQHLMSRGLKHPFQLRMIQNRNSNLEGPSSILMKIGFWNVMGLNRPLKQNGVAHLIKNNQLCLLGILETKLVATAIPKIIHRSFSGWCQANNFDAIVGGCILIIWNPAIIDLHPEDISPQVIHCRVTNKSSQLSFYISFTYGLYNVVNRRSMWEKLLELGQPLSMPWIILGDFNCVKSPAEEQLGFPPQLVRAKEANLALQNGQTYLESNPGDAAVRDSLWDLRKKTTFLAEVERHFYYQKAKIHFLKAVMDFFRSGRMLRQLNHTIIALVPKSEHSPSVADYRSLSCCNVIYKVITKIIADRLSPALEQLIDSSQAAFVGGQNITDNIFLAQEMVRQYSRKRI